jgi:hypothetical protein
VRRFAARTLGALGPLVGVALLALPGSALAAWSLSGVGGAAGGATTMPAGTAPSGAGGANQAALSWSAAELPGGSTVEGYIVHAYDAASGALESVAGGCAGLVSTTSCTATAIPAGTWLFTVTPVQNNWTGSESPESAPVEVYLS